MCADAKADELVDTSELLVTRLVTDPALAPFIAILLVPISALLGLRENMENSALHEHRTFVELTH